MLIMLTVAATSIFLNAQLKRLEAEKRAKLAVFEMRKKLRRMRVLLDADIGRYIYDDGNEVNNQYNSIILNRGDTPKKEKKRKEFIHFSISP